MAASEKVTLALDPELAAQIAEVGRSLGTENKAEIIRMLLRQSIAAVPWDSPSLRVTQEALTSMRHWAFGRLREKFAEIQREMESV